MIWGSGGAEGRGQEEKVRESAWVLEASIFVPALPKPFSFIPSATKFH